MKASDGAGLWTMSSGSGPGFVLCHGGPGLHDYLGPVADMINDHYTVHRWDQRGAGRSSLDGPFTLARFVADLEDLRMIFGHERVVVAGHSWGANLALLYALEHPERTEALIYMSGTGLAWGKWNHIYHEEEESRLAPEERARFLLLKGKKQRTPDEEFEFQVLNDMTNFADPRHARSLAEADVKEMLKYPINYEANSQLSAEIQTLDESELVTRCGRLDIPVLVVHGEADPRPAAAVDSLVEALPRCLRVVLAGVAHMPWLEDPDSLRYALRDFLVLA